MPNPFQPEYLILHDYGGTPGANPKFNPYHALVSGGGIAYRNPNDPYGQPAPHAYKLNPRSIGLSWGGPVGGKPSKEEFALLKQEYDAIKKRFPNIKVLSHGEAYQQTRGTGQQASKLGRGLEEAAWRKYLLGDMPYEPGTVSPQGPVPMSQRSLTAVAGHSQTQPPTTGAPQPMATYKDVGGQAPVMDPAEVARRQNMAQMLMRAGTNPGPMRHWTQALGAVLQGGAGMYQGKQAAQGLAQGQQSGNAALAAMLMGNDPSAEQAALSNPYSQGMALKYQMDQRKTAQDFANQQQLKRMEIDAKASDPMRQLQREKLEAEIRSLNNKPPKLSVGQEALDRNFAKVYSEDIAGGALSDAVTQLETLEQLANKLEKPEGKNFTGPWLGLVPESVRAYTNPDSVDAQNQVANIVQRSLRPILGAQFTEKEGENLIKRAYNPQLDEKTNAARLRKLANVARKMAQQKLEAAKYWEENGTLTGFQGSASFSIADVENAIDAINTSTPSKSGDGASLPAIDVPQSEDGWTTFNGVKIRVKP